MGASGTARSDADWSITYRFEMNSNRVGITIGSMTLISVKGWEVLWVYSETEKVNGRYAPVPKQASVEQIYETDGFAAVLGI